MKEQTATAISHPNIAFIKYWGNKNTAYRIPLNNSISANLRDLHTKTTVTFRDDLKEDTLTINHLPAETDATQRVSIFLEIIRALAGMQLKAEVISENNFPMGAGIASSAAAFSALAVAGSAAAGLSLGEKDLSRLARRGSGSASRSIPAGFVEWFAGTEDADSFAVSIADEKHWALADCIAIINPSHKITGSSLGHTIADTSPLQNARIASVQERLTHCRESILQKDFQRLAEVTELDSTMMHAVMMTSYPALFYWEPASINIMKEIPLLRAKGLPVCYTLDAGANVHVICEASGMQEVHSLLMQIPGVQSVIDSEIGGPAKLI
jgi:diphosphomevalonate decarboxylase